MHTYRHEQQLGEMKRDYDLSCATQHQQHEAKIQEIEQSVEERALQRVDAVTSKTIVINKRRLLEIENLHKEVGAVNMWASLVLGTGFCVYETLGVG